MQSNTFQNLISNKQFKKFKKFNKLLKATKIKVIYNNNRTNSKSNNKTSNILIELELTDNVEKA